MAFSLSKSLNIICRQFLLKPGLRAQVPTRVSAASICSKELIDPNIKKPKPWPYQTKRYTYFHWHIDGTLKRFDENTKIIVIEGNIGAGKTAVAKQLADVFGMIYFPEPDIAATYITPYGYDLRQLDHIMPPSYKCCDIDTFYKNPHHRNVTSMQFRMLMMRYSDYLDAIAHILNTGQGIVMDRCVFSDMVFLETMYKSGYVRREAREYYQEIYLSVTEELLRPHLIIYLDVPPEVSLQRIKERNKESEVNSKVLTEDYLSHIEHFYKQQYLKEYSKYSELLIYDWSSYGDVEVVVEDIERINFGHYAKHDLKLKDWRNKDDWEWGTIRRAYTNNKRQLLKYGNVFRPRVSEVFHPAEEVQEYNEIMEKVPGTQYQPGFNPSMGDNILFKIYAQGDFDKDRIR